MLLSVSMFWVNLDFEAEKAFKDIKELLISPHNRYFEVLVDHKAIEYKIKSKLNPPLPDLKHYY